LDSSKLSIEAKSKWMGPFSCLLDIQLDCLSSNYIGNEIDGKKNIGSQH